jgi:hypothetical protein
LKEELVQERTAIIPVHFDDGTKIQIEATIFGGEEKVTALKKGMAFEGVMKPIRKMASEVAKLVQEIEPDRASVQMGFEVATSEGQLTALLVKGTATANLTVTFEWVKEQKPLKRNRK